MVDFFDKLYFRIKNNNVFLQKIRFYSLLRFGIRTIANYIIPIYFKITSNNPLYRLEEVVEYDERIIVSLTSFPARINNIWLVIETILRQTVKPDIIVLWLSKEQFSSIGLLPKKLLKLRERGLLIELVDDDLRSHKKYYYSFKKFPDDIIITVDDDIFYNSNIIENLVNNYNIYSNCIICNFALKVAHQNNKILPYDNWELITAHYGPSNQLMPIGAGGILYPPYSMHKDVLNIEIFRKYCLLADDIWLNIMSRLNNTSTVKTSFNSYYLPIQFKSNTTLTQTNVISRLNDKQLNDTRNYYITTMKQDPFYQL